MKQKHSGPGLRNNTRERSATIHACLWNSLVYSYVSDHRVALSCIAFNWPMPLAVRVWTVIVSSYHNQIQSVRLWWRQEVARDSLAGREQLTSSLTCQILNHDWWVGDVLMQITQKSPNTKRSEMPRKTAALANPLNTITWPANSFLNNVLPVFRAKATTNRLGKETWRIMEMEQFHKIMTFSKIRQDSHASLVCPRSSSDLSLSARAGW